MRANQWRAYLEAEHRESGKAVFTVAELANVAGRDAHALNVELARLLKAGVIARYAQGRYGLPGIAGLEELLAQIDASAYVTGHWVLHRLNLVDQRPTIITCFTARRHNRSRLRDTPVGRLAFSTVARPIYCPPDDAPLAGGEQALCDFVYLCFRRGLRPESLVRLRSLDRLSAERILGSLNRYPRTVQAHVCQLCGLQAGS